MNRPPPDSRRGGFPGQNCLFPGDVAFAQPPKGGSFRKSPLLLGQPPRLFLAGRGSAPGVAEMKGGELAWRPGLRVFEPGSKGA